MGLKTMCPIAKGMLRNSSLKKALERLLSRTDLSIVMKYL